MVEELVEQVDPLLVRRVSQLLEKGLVKSIQGYPKAVFFILANEFCERFSFYGMKALLILYFVTEHKMLDSTATMFYHAFTCVAFGSPLLGSLLADSYLGRFRVILYVSILYVIGHLLLSIGAVPSIGYDIRSFLDFSGLLVIGFATGGIKPCVSAFAADQEERAQFFSFFYFAINAGSLFAILLTPILKTEISCFGNQYCFPLAFGVPGVLMFVALVLFLCGIRFYKMHPAGRENVAGAVTRCIYTAACRRLADPGWASHLVTDRSAKDMDWLALASPEHPPELIRAVRSFVNVSIIFVPIVFFWALFDQQGSTWILQATRMDGRVGKVIISPEQMNVLNPILILILVPLFESVVYPMARKMVRVTPLRKMGVGGCLAAFAFLVAGFLQLHINQSITARPETGGYLHIVGEIETVLWNNTEITLNGTQVAADEYVLEVEKKSFPISVKAGRGVVAGVFRGPSVAVIEYEVKNEKGKARLVVLSGNETGHIIVIDSNGEIKCSHEMQNGAIIDLVPAMVSSPEYTIHYGENCTRGGCPHKLGFHLQTGGVWVLYASSRNASLVEVVRPNSVSLLWMFPQCLIMTIGEILLSVTGLEFAYSQSSPNMRSVLQAMWLLTVFFGNLLAMGISGSQLLPDPAYEFFFYSTLMFVVMGVFALLAVRYRYVDETRHDAQC